MITTFVVRCLDSTIPLLAIAEISRPKLVFLAEQAGLSLNWSQTPKASFVVTWLIYDPPHDKTNKTESLLCTQRIAKDQSFLHADSENYDQTRWMLRLI